MNIDILYQDAHLLIVNKPAGIPVHAGPKGGPNMEQMVASLFDPRKRAPSLAHRLDRDTSGCLVFGKTVPALRRMQHVFETKQVTKTYWAITGKAPEEADGLIDAPLAKRADDPRSWWMEVNPAKGQSAQTRYTMLRISEDGRALIECSPLTGRTHQIRVHLAHIGCPIIGDPVYGVKGGAYSPLLLHARSITIPFEGKTSIHVEAAPPAVFQEAAKAITLTP